MSEHATKEQKIATTAPAAGSSGEDLSKELELTMEKRSDERIRVVRLFGNCYRANWWVQDTTPHAAWLSTGTIRKSSFLHADRTADGLKVEHAK